MGHSTAISSETRRIVVGRIRTPYGDGDFDLNGRVDLRDAAEAQVCFGAFALPECNPANLTGDGFIRLEDFAEFVALLSGP